MLLPFLTLDPYPFFPHNYMYQCYPYKRYLLASYYKSVLMLLSKTVTGESLRLVALEVRALPLAIMFNPGRERHAAQSLGPTLSERCVVLAATRYPTYDQTPVLVLRPSMSAMIAPECGGCTNLPNSNPRGS